MTWHAADVLAGGDSFDEKNRQRLLISGIVFSFLLLTAHGSASAQDLAVTDGENTESIVISHEKIDSKCFVVARIITHATPAKVWSSILEEPRHDKHLLARRVLSRSDSKSVVEEHFTGVPLVGETTCVIETEESPGVSMSVKLLSSNHLKALEAAWTLKPTNEARSTIVELKCWTEIKCFCPDMLLERAVVSRIRRRLAFVKQYAESLTDDKIAYQNLHCANTGSER